MHPRRSWSKCRHLHPPLTSWSAKRKARVRGTPVKPLVKPFRQTISRLLRQTVSSNRSIKSKMFWKQRGLNSQPPAPQSNAITIRPRCPPSFCIPILLVKFKLCYIYFDSCGLIPYKSLLSAKDLYKNMCLVGIETNNQVKLTSRKKSSKIYTLKSWSGLNKLQ